MVTPGAEYRWCHPRAQRGEAVQLGVPPPQRGLSIFCYLSALDCPFLGCLIVHNRSFYMVKITAYAAYRAAIQKFSRKTLKLCVRQTSVEVKNWHEFCLMRVQYRLPQRRTENGTYLCSESLLAGVLGANFSPNRSSTFLEFLSSEGQCFCREGSQTLGVMIFYRYSKVWRTVIMVRVGNKVPYFNQKHFRNETLD